MSPNDSSCMFSSDLTGCEELSTLMVRTGDRSLGFDVMTIAKRPRGVKSERFDWSRKVSILLESISYFSNAMYEVSW